MPRAQIIRDNGNYCAEMYYDFDRRRRTKSGRSVITSERWSRSGDWRGGVGVRERLFHITLSRRIAMETARKRAHSSAITDFAQRFIGAGKSEKQKTKIEAKPRKTNGETSATVSGTSLYYRDRVNSTRSVPTPDGIDRVRTHSPPSDPSAFHCFRGDYLYRKKNNNKN